MPGEFPPDSLDKDGLPRGLRGGADPKPAKKAAAKKKAPAKKKD